MKFLIVGAIETDNTKDLEDEILKAGFHVSKIKPQDIIFSVQNGKFQVTSNEMDLLDFDVYLLRGYNVSVTEVMILAEALLALEKTVVDNIAGNLYLPSKLFEASRLSREGLNYPETFSILKGDSFEFFKNKLKYPVIVKPVNGQKGQDIVKFEKEKELEEFLSESNKGWLVQECLPMDGDVRVFVVGDEVLGAMKRFIVKGDFRSNASLGAETGKFELTDEIRDIALRAKKAMNCEIAGVDLAWSNGRWYVIEVNFTPQWQAFKEATGTNPAEKIIEYAINKHNQQSQL